MSSFEETKSGIRLSSLNTEIRDRLTKFDTTNDGELSLEEAIQGLIALQKQSNNYKRTLYLLFPVMFLMIASIFGVNMLALKLTKDLHSETTNSVPVLTNKDGNILSTSAYSKSINMIDWLNYEYSPSIDTITFGDLNLNVNGVYLERLSNVSRIYVSTPLIYFYIGNDMTFDVGYTTIGNENNQFAFKAKDLIYNYLFNIVNTINNKSVKIRRDDVPTDITVSTRQPRLRGYGCGLIATIC